jgi:hypothetical protein
VKSSDPRPRFVEVRSTQPARVNLAACDLAVTGAHPIAHAHASIGAGPTRASQHNPPPDLPERASLDLGALEPADRDHLMVLC